LSRDARHHEHRHELTNTASIEIALQIAMASTGRRKFVSIAVNATIMAKRPPQLPISKGGDLRIQYKWRDKSQQLRGAHAPVLCLTTLPYQPAPIMTRLLLPFALFVLFAVQQSFAGIAGYAVSQPALDTEVHPRLVAAASNGNVWFYQQMTKPYSIGFFTASGHVTSFAIPCTKCATGAEVVYVWDLAADRDGSVWFIDNHATANGASIDSAIGHLTTSGEFSFFAIPTRNATAIVPEGFGHSFLALADDGTVWFTENGGFQAGKLTPSTASFFEYPLEMPEQPSGITIGADGKIWYAIADHEIAQITPPSNGDFVEFSLASGAQPFALATGTDGNIWLTESGRHKIARIKPNGTISEFQPPTTDGTPQHIAAAPDGRLWYTESTGMDVGRITLDSSSVPTFEVLATPGQQNFDITVSGATVYFTGRDLASGQDVLSMLSVPCSHGPVITGPDMTATTRTFHGVFTISGKEPLNISVMNLPAGWSAQTGTVTLVDSVANAAVGNYTFTISVTDGDGCSTSRQIAVDIVKDRRRATRH
jgi:streptogramin lyase